MELTGDAEGLAALKALHQQDKSYLKFLIGEARSNTDFTAPFTAPDGKKWKLVFDPRTGALTVSPRA